MINAGVFDFGKVISSQKPSKVNLALQTST
jgi:hypothetical protein